MSDGARVAAAAGELFVGADLVFPQFHALGALPHPPFLTSLVASVTAGIGAETARCLSFVPAWMRPGAGCPGGMRTVMEITHNVLNAGVAGSARPNPAAIGGRTSAVD